MIMQKYQIRKFRFSGTLRQLENDLLHHFVNAFNKITVSLRILVSRKAPKGIWNAVVKATAFVYTISFGDSRVRAFTLLTIFRTHRARTCEGH